MLTIDNILNLQISYQKDTWSDIESDIPLNKILDAIKTKKFDAQINILRTELNKGNKEYYDNYKKRLPATTFSGTFKKKRTQENLKNYNPLIVLDIDKLNSEEMVKVYSELLNENIVFSFWKSPSNNGFKGLVPLNFNIESKELSYAFLHKCAFRKLSQYFIETYNIELDKSGSDITRLCFISSDSELVLKNEVSFFEIHNSDIEIIQKSKENSKKILRVTNSKDALYNPLNKNNPRDRKFMSDIIKYLERKNKTITYNYNDWCKVAMAISNTFTYDIGLKYFKKLSILDKQKYNEITCTNFLTNCYETRNGDVNFSTIVYLANQQGYKTKYQKNGVPKAEE